MADIFLSYVKGDRDRARLVAGALEAKGWDVFWDQEIPVGETWASHIEVQLRAAGAVVVLWSEASIESVWVGKEARFAEREGKYVPALIDDVAPPFEFEHVQAANLIAWKGAESGEGYERLLAAISRRVPLPMSEEQEPEEPPEAEDTRLAEEDEGERRPKKLPPHTASRFREWVARIDRRIWIGGSVSFAAAVIALLAWQVWPSAQPPDPRIEDFSASAASITEGDEVTLTWRTSYADSVYLVPLGGASSSRAKGLVAPSGSTSVTPREDGEYVLRAYGPQAPVEWSIRITVTAAPVEARRPAPPPPVPAEAQRPILPPGADDPLNRPVWIEGGTFSMGSEDGDSDERPVHRVTVSGFWIQEHEVTNEEYQRFDPEHEFPSGEEKHPVVNVTWQEAMHYAASRGGSLPTEAQWEFAARGTEGRKYPWGDLLPTCERGHHLGCPPYEKIPVMSRPDGATPDGIHDLAGNVWEWVADWYGEYEPGPQRDPRGPARGAYHVLRGASIRDVYPYLRASKRGRAEPEYEWEHTGFRVAWSSAAGQD